MKGRCANKHTGTRSPKYFLYIIVLTGIFFHRPENSSAAEWITQVIYKAARSTGKFKLITIGKRKQLWLAGSYSCIPLHQRYYRLYPAGRNFHVGIQQHIIICIY